MLNTLPNRDAPKEGEGLVGTVPHLSEFTMAEFDGRHLRGLQDSSRSNSDGTLALLVVMLVVFCLIWAPACRRRCRRRETVLRPGLSRTYNDEELENIQAEFIRNTLRQMAEDGGLNQSMSNLPREDRKTFIANVLQTKKVMLKNGTTDEESDTKPQSVSGNDLEQTESHVIMPSSVEGIDGKNEGTQQCAICLTEYEDGDEICVSPNTNCNHVFHRECISEWLLNHEECPCCRNHYLSLGEDDDTNRRTEAWVPPVPPNQTETDGPNFGRDLHFFHFLLGRQPSNISDTPLTLELPVRDYRMDPDTLSAASSENSTLERGLRRLFHLTSHPTTSETDEAPRSSAAQNETENTPAGSNGEEAASREGTVQVNQPTLDGEAANPRSGNAESIVPSSGNEDTGHVSEDQQDPTPRSEESVSNSQENSSENRS